MRIPRLLGIPAILLAAAALGFGAPKAFEGKITFLMTTDNGTLPFTYYMKGGLVRTEMNSEKGQMGVMLMNPAKREMTILMPQQKMYMVHQMKDQANPAAGSQGSDQTPGVEFQRTGQYETILGYRCEKVIVKSKEGSAEIWGTEGLGTFMNPNGANPMGRRGAPRSAWEAELANRGFFPLRVVGHDNKGKQSFKMEATEIDKSTPDDSLFVPPPDYRKFEMPSLGGLNPFSR